MTEVKKTQRFTIKNAKDELAGLIGGPLFGNALAARYKDLLHKAIDELESAGRLVMDARTSANGANVRTCEGCLKIYRTAATSWRPELRRYACAPCVEEHHAEERREYEAKLAADKKAKEEAEAKRRKEQEEERQRVYRRAMDAVAFEPAPVKDDSATSRLIVDEYKLARELVGLLDPRKTKPYGYRHVPVSKLEEWDRLQRQLGA